MIRILFVAHVSRLGGGELSLLDLVQVLDRHAFELVVALPAVGELSVALEDSGVRVVFCPWLCRLHRRGNVASWVREAVALAAGTVALARLVARERPDFVHANSTTAALFALVAARLHRCRLVWHARDADPTVAATLLGAAAAHVVVASRFCRAQLLRFVPRDRITVIANGVDLTRFVGGDVPARSKAAPAEGPLIVTIGQLVSWKRYDLLLEAAARVHARAPSARFLVLGDDRFGDRPDAAERLQAQIDTAGLTATVQLGGHRRNVETVLAAADFLVHPAYPEPYGRVIVEAMAVGRPVIAFGGDHGPSELLADGGGGILVSPRTSQALAEAILTLIDHPARAEQLGRAGRTRAEQRYDRRTMGLRFEALYQSLANRTRSAADHASP